MKTDKIFKCGIILVLLVLITFPSAAQPPDGRGQGEGQHRQRNEEDVKNRVERLAESLDLSDAQEASLLEYEISAFKKGQEFRENNAGDREAMRTYRQAARKEREQKLAEILSDEQMAKYNEQQEQRRQAREQGNSPNTKGNTQRDRGRGRQ